MERAILWRDVGFDCEGVTRADSEEDGIAQAVNDHARTAHGLTEIADEFAYTVHAAVCGQ